MITVELVPLDELRQMLARRERINRIRDLLPVGEIETGEVLTDILDGIDVDALTVQRVLEQVQDAKLAAYMSGIPTMAVIAS